MAKRGVNKVIVLGNLGQEPEYKVSQSGKPMVRMSVATSDVWKDKETGEKKERTEWHQVIFFDRKAEIANEYLSKGSKVYVEGSLRTRKWQDSNGADHYSTEIIGNEMQLLDPKPTNSQNNLARQPVATQANEPERHASGNVAQQNPTYTPNAVDDWDDDIPF